MCGQWEKVRALLEIYLRNENASVPFQKSEPSLSMFAIRPKAYTDQTVAIVVVIVVAVVAAVVAAVVKNPFHAFRPTGYMVLIPIIYRPIGTWLVHWSVLLQLLSLSQNLFLVPNKYIFL